MLKKVQHNAKGTASKLCQRQASARHITGTNPAHNTKFLSSKLTCLRVAQCHNGIEWPAS